MGRSGFTRVIFKFQNSPSSAGIFYLIRAIVDQNYRYRSRNTLECVCEIAAICQISIFLYYSQSQKVKQSERSLALMYELMNRFVLRSQIQKLLDLVSLKASQKFVIYYQVRYLVMERARLRHVGMLTLFMSCLRRSFSVIIKLFNYKNIITKNSLITLQLCSLRRQSLYQSQQVNPSTRRYPPVLKETQFFYNYIAFQNKNNLKLSKLKKYFDSSHKCQFSLIRCEDVQSCTLLKQHLGFSSQVTVFPFEQLKQDISIINYAYFRICQGKTFIYFLNNDKALMDPRWLLNLKQQNQMKTKYQNGDDVQMVIRTQKESQSGLFNNQRLLMIKAGIVSYFSSIPKKFSGSARAIEMSGQVPKFTIAANEISKIELKGVQLSMLVLKSKLISRNEFGQMVKGTKNIPQSHGKAKADGGGYEQWIFKSEDEESLIQFYHLINLFRTNNPNFQPHLSEMVQVFQNKKNPRKTTMVPSSVSQHSMPFQASNRMSEVPKSKPHQITIQKQPQKPILPPPIAPQFEQEDVLKQNPPVQKKSEGGQIRVQQEENDEEERLNMVKEKINYNNHPRMSIIQQKPGQDKISQMSRALDLNHRITIQVIRTFDQQKQVQAEDVQPIQEVMQEQKQQKQPKEFVKVEEDQTVQNNQNKQEIKSQSNLQKQPAYQSFLNPSFQDLQSKFEFEIKHQKKIKVNQMIKSAFSLHKRNYKNMAESLKISVQQLVQFLKVNNQEEEDNWDFIENELARIVASKENEFRQLKNLNFSTNLISKYHNLSDIYVNLDLKSYQLLEGEVSFDNLDQDSNQQNMIMQWMKTQLSSQLTKSFSTKVFHKFQCKISLRQITFDPKEIICIKGSWIVNKEGYLIQFLAYLSLQKIVRELKSKEKGKFQIQCAEVFYIRYKQYQTIVKQLRVSNSYYPLKSIKALEFIGKAKSMKHFQQSFPNFIVNVQIQKNQEIYRFHLQKTSAYCASPSAIQNQLKKLHFTIDSQLQIFYATTQYEMLKNDCILKLKQIQNQSKKMSQKSLREVVSKASSNIQVDTIFKWLGARLDKNDNIIFQPTLLKLGNHQFGFQYSLIKKTRKKGNYELSKSLSKRLMGKLHYYRLVSPTSNFIAVYLQLIDMMILEKGELHRAVPMLLKMSQFLSDYELQKYSVYLALMRSYIKLHQIQNFIKTLQNCRLFLQKMFGENAFIFDFPFYRTIIAFKTYQNTSKGLDLSQKLIQSALSQKNLSQELTQKVVSKLVWDICNIYITKFDYFRAYQTCNSQLELLQNTEGCLQSYWIQGVVCLAKAWSQMKEVNPFNSAILQKRVQRAIGLSLSRELFDIAFLLKDLGQKILQKCKQLHLPRYLQGQAAFEQTKIQFNSTREQMHQLIVQAQ